MMEYIEHTLCLAWNGEGVHCTVRTLDGNLHLEVEVDQLSESERKAWGKKIKTLRRRYPELAGFTSMVVETTAEAVAREEAAQPVKKTKKRSAKSKADQELAEVREALKAAGISRAKLKRVLESAYGRDYCYIGSDKALKKIL